MANDDQLEKSKLKAQLSVMANKVPAAINSGSVQAVREYKKLVTEINKAVSGNKANVSKLTGLLRQLSSYSDANRMANS